MVLIKKVKIVALPKTKKQHIHAKFCIKKFSKFNSLLKKECVELQYVTNSYINKFNPDDKIFCGSWLWDWRTEFNSWPIETAFHNEIKNAIEGLGKPRNHKAISDYHLLWWARHHFRHNPNQDQVMASTPDSSLSKEGEENCESNGYMYANNGVMPARFLTSILLWAFRRSKIDYYDGLHWSLVESQEGEFIVADCYQCILFMPISPTKAFVAYHPKDEIITRDNVAKLNQLSISVATKYYFSSNFNQCPIIV